MRLRAEAAQSAAPQPSEKSTNERGTVALPDGLESAPSLPFKEAEVAPEAVDLSIFPIDRYAEVTVALAKSEDRAAGLRRFVLTEAMWKAVAQAWGGRITADPSLRVAFDAAVKRARERG